MIGKHVACCAAQAPLVLRAFSAASFLSPDSGLGLSVLLYVLMCCDQVLTWNARPHFGMISETWRRVRNDDLNAKSLASSAAMLNCFCGFWKRDVVSSVLLVMHVRIRVSRGV